MQHVYAHYCVFTEGRPGSSAIDSRAIEKRHEERYRKLAELVKNKKVFKKTGKKVWICRNCGHIHVGNEAPKVCPVCNHPQAYFELVGQNY